MSSDDVVLKITENYIRKTMKEDRLKVLHDSLNAIQDAHDTLEEVRDEEEEAYDNMPEGLQYSERGDMMQEAIDSLDEAVGLLDDVVSSLEDVVSSAEDPDVMEIEPWKNLTIGNIVTHKSYGKGAIIEIDGNYYTIQFQEKAARFIFPDAIDKGFITL